MSSPGSTGLRRTCSDLSATSGRPNTQVPAGAVPPCSTPGDQTARARCRLVTERPEQSHGAPDEDQRHHITIDSNNERPQTARVAERCREVCGPPSPAERSRLVTARPDRERQSPWYLPEPPWLIISAARPTIIS